MRAGARRWAAGAVLVTVGWLGSPGAVPVYDGVSAPDEPYRYVTRPEDTAPTAPAKPASAHSPVQHGISTNGLTVQTDEQGPQASLFVPRGAMAAPGSDIEVRLEPQAPTDQPKGARIDGNVYLIRLVDPAGAVTLTKDAGLASLYLRATTAKQPGPTLQYRADPAAAWAPLRTSRGGMDVYVGHFAGAGQYALAFAEEGGGSGSSLRPYVLLGGVLLLVVVVVVVRLRASQE